MSPAGAAVGTPLSDVLRAAYFVGPRDELSPLACAFARARGADRVSSYCDWIALSDAVDLPTARLIRREVSDGIIAPAYTPEAFESVGLTEEQVAHAAEQAIGVLTHVSPAVA